MQSNYSVLKISDDFASVSDFESEIKSSVNFLLLVVKDRFIANCIKPEIVCD